ncbi:MAG TPA: isoprenylcysteine carboxylmethyltransferase family protein [Phenylobacterium sp.]|jgi:protein-S-isoprenylcysteine O-methyltransferase Ste14
MTLHRLVPLVLVAMLIALESYAGRERRAGAQARDAGSLYVLYALIAVGYGAAFMLWRYDTGGGRRLGEWALWTGAAVGAAGLALRLWSVVTLGQYFTYVVRVSGDQKVVDTGPYRLIRHPSYTGGLLAAVGIGLSMRRADAVAVIGLTNLAAYLIRIRVEERALAETLGEPYRAYMARTRRLVPFLW